VLAFSATHLTGMQWLFCICCGLTEFIWQQVIITCTNIYLAQKQKKEAAAAGANDNKTAGNSGKYSAAVHPNPEGNGQAAAEKEP
jgi:hypothetical protein